MIIRGILRTVAKTVRLLRGADLRSYARGYLDQALEEYGYVRRAEGWSGALPMLGAFGAGFAVGTGFGILVAPASGGETRKRIREQLERGRRESNGKSRGVITDDPEITRERPVD